MSLARKAPSKQPTSPSPRVLSMHRRTGSDDVSQSSSLPRRKCAVASCHAPASHPESSDLDHRFCAWHSSAEWHAHATYGRVEDEEPTPRRSLGTEVSARSLRPTHGT
jgi:hypothetical protein